MQTRAYAAQAADQPLAPFTIARRAIGDRDVQVAIDFCGICHSDIPFGVSRRPLRLQEHSCGRRAAVP